MADGPRRSSCQNRRKKSAPIVKIARDCGEPIVARGAGTGLCGGAVPTAGGVIVSLMRMNRILELDLQNRRVRVQAGVMNLDVSRQVAPEGLFYAPDPSSQQISTIGGNIATNAGGPHCLSYGTTVNHVLGLEVVDEAGEVFTTSIDDAGYDLTAALVGSEGTLGLVTSAWLGLLALPEAVRVWVATFDEMDAASEAVSAIIAAGIVPTALEMMDAVIVAAVEAAFHAGYPTDAAALLLVESAGFEEDVAASEAAIHAIVKAHGARYWKSARTLAERNALVGWTQRRRGCDRTDRTELLHARRLRAAQQAPSSTPCGRSGSAFEPDHRGQRLSRGRRKLAPASDVR